MDILIVRELTGGIYLGAHKRAEDVEGAGMNGASYHLAQAHAHEPGRLERHPHSSAHTLRGAPESMSDT